MMNMKRLRNRFYLLFGNLPDVAINAGITFSIMHGIVIPGILYTNNQQISRVFKNSLKVNRYTLIELIGQYIINYSGFIILLK